MLIIPYSAAIVASEPNGEEGDGDGGDNNSECSNDDSETANRNGGDYVMVDGTVDDSNDNGSDPNKGGIGDFKDGLNGLNEDSQLSEGDHALSLPPWMPHAKNYLLSIKAGGDWKKLVESWLRFEELIGYPDREVNLFTSF